MTSHSSGKLKIDKIDFGNKALEMFPSMCGGGGGAILYNGEYGCAAGTFKPLPFADKNFESFADKWQLYTFALLKKSLKLC